MVKMLFTILIMVLLPGSVPAGEVAQHVTEVAAARAQITSGVRISREQMAVDQDTPARGARLPKPRERPCPKEDEHPCRLIVVDMP